MRNTRGSLIFQAAVTVIALGLAGVSMATAGMQRAADETTANPWTAWRGGFHAIHDITFDPAGTPWAAGIGIITGGNGRWRVTDWGSSEPGTRFEAIEMDGPGLGWAVANHEAGFGSSAHTGEIVRIRNGRIVMALRFPGVGFSDLAMVSASDLWAVGWTTRQGPRRPVVYHYDGQAWADQSVLLDLSGLSDRLLMDIDMLAPDRGYILAHDGLLLRWDGGRWGVWRDTPTLDFIRNDLDALPSGEIWLVGGNDDLGVIDHFDGQTWHTETWQGGRLWSIAMVSSRLGWAVGDYGDILAYDGTAWRRIGSSETLSVMLAGLTIVATVPGQQRALAADGQEGQVLSITAEGFERLAGASWLGRFFSSIAPDGRGGAWIGGGRCAPENCWVTPPLTRTDIVPLLMHWDGRTSESVESLPTVDGGILSIAQQDPTSVWAVGGRFPASSPGRPIGFILHGDGKHWRQLGDLTHAGLTRVQVGADGSVWAIGSRGYNDLFEEAEVVQIDTTGWRVRDRLGPGIRLRDLSALSGQDVWVVGERYEQDGPDAPVKSTAVLRHFDGSGWDDVSIENAAGLDAIDMTASGSGWIGGRTSNGTWTLYERVAGQWQARQVLDAHVETLLMLSDDDGFAGTGQGQIYRLTSGQWRPDFTEPDRYSSLFNFNDLALLDRLGSEPVVATVGDAETIMVRSDAQRPLWTLFLPFAAKRPAQQSH